MTYVEWLRVRGCLKWTAIVMGILFLCGVGVRLYFFSRGDLLMFVNDERTTQSSTVSNVVLPDGTKRTTIDNAKEKVHIVIDDHGYAGQHITIVAPKGSRASQADHVVFGSVDVEDTPNGANDVVSIDTNHPEAFVFYAAIATLAALIVATVLGAPFARESDGHLEFAFTKPISRLALAASTIGVDCAGIVLAWAVTVVVLIASGMLFQSLHITFGFNDALGTALCLLGCFAWYAMINAATASMRRGYGVMQGIAWPVVLGIMGAGNSKIGDLQLLQALHNVMHVLTYVIPLEYMHISTVGTPDGQGSVAVGAASAMPIMALLFLGYAALAVVQWRRVEA